MDLNTFTIDQLPFQTSEALPKDCAKYDVTLGAVPDEKDGTNPVYYMDEIFAGGGDSPVPPTPVGPPANEIWYWGEYYDIENVIEVLSQQGPYVGPAILSNEQVGNKYVITFNGPVTKLGGDFDSKELYPIFMTEPHMGVECNITSIEIPNSITSIGMSAFYGCTGLTSITIPNSVTSIGNMAFWSCGSLAAITIPDNVTSIGSMAFYMGDHEIPYEYPIKTFIANGITYETNNRTEIKIVLSNGEEVNLILWEPLGGSVQVTVVDGAGGEHDAILDDRLTYAEQEYSGYYSQSTYNSDMGEAPEDFLVDDDYPVEGDTIYETIEDEAEPEPGEEVTIDIYDVDGVFVRSVLLRNDETFSQQGYEGYYTTNEYDSSIGETPDTYLADNCYPGEEIALEQYLDIIYNDIRDIAEPEDVEVTIVDEDGTSKTVTLDGNQTYADQGYVGYYSQNTYDSDAGESDADFLVDDTYPEDGETIYDYCNDISEPTEEVEVTIEHDDGGESPETITLSPEETYADQGYTGYYSQDIYNSSAGENPEDFLVDGNYPEDGDIIYEHIEDIAEPDEEEP